MWLISVLNGQHGVLNWDYGCVDYDGKLLVCSTGLIIFSNGHYWWSLWEIIMCSTGHCWCAQQEIIEVHIVMGVSNIPNVRPGGICMPFKSTFSYV